MSTSTPTSAQVPADTAPAVATYTGLGFARETTDVSYAR